MPEPLQKRTKKDGVLYRRRVVVEREIIELEDLSSANLVARIRSGDTNKALKVGSEAIVHFIRRDLRIAKNDSAVEGTVDALCSILVKRCERNLKYKLRTYDDLSREEISKQVLDRLVDDLIDDGDSADYAEVNFNHWLAGNRNDAIRKHGRRARRGQLVESVDSFSETEGQTAHAGAATAVAVDQETPEGLYSHKEAMEEAGLPFFIQETNFTAEDLWRIATVVKEAKLSDAVLEAFLANKLGRKIVSQDPSEHTLVKHFGKSERTIRNWITKAEQTFTELRKKG